MQTAEADRKRKYRPGKKTGKTQEVKQAALRAAHFFKSPAPKPPAGPGPAL